MLRIELIIVWNVYVVKCVRSYKIKSMLRPQNEALGFVVFIALFILDPEMESPKTSEAGNPELYPIFRFLPRYPKYASSYLFWSFQEGMLLIS